MKIEMLSKSDVETEVINYDEGITNLFHEYCENRKDLSEEEVNRLMQEAGVNPYDNSKYIFYEIFQTKTSKSISQTDFYKMKEKE
jgi:hypothetical protein